MSDESLDLVSPPPVRRRWGDREFEIYPVRIKDLAAFSRAIEPIATEIFKGEFTRALRFGDLLIEAVAVGARIEDRGWLGEQNSALLRELMSGIVEANPSFFGQTELWRAILRNLGLDLVAASGGPTSSTDSSPPDTPAPTSST